MARFLISREIAGKSATAFEHLRRLALEGELPLGRRLAPQDLARYFGVSASPVRDALMRLSTEGLISWKMSQGFFSKPFEVEDQRQLHETLLVLLSAAIGRLRPAPPHDLLQTLSALDAAPGAPVTELEDLLAALTAAADNRVQSEMMRTVIDRTHLPRKLDAATASGLDHPAGALRAIGRALLDENPDGAVAAARHLVEGRIARLPGLVDQANARGLHARLA
jgi:DNA-binding GntR family transcriptional regulator